MVFSTDTLLILDTALALSLKKYGGKLKVNPLFPALLHHWFQHIKTYTSGDTELWALKGGLLWLNGKRMAE